MARTPYDVNASWDDPYERRNERRQVGRTPVNLKIKIAVDLANKPAPLVGPGVVDDISPTGLRCRTKHSLTAGQFVKIQIPTKDMPSELGLPKGFIGAAQVTRAEQRDGGICEVAVRFDEDLRTDIHLAIFVEHLQTMGRVASA